MPFVEVDASQTAFLIACRVVWKSNRRIVLLSSDIFETRTRTELASNMIHVSDTVTPQYCFRIWGKSSFTKYIGPNELEIARWPGIIHVVPDVNFGSHLLKLLDKRRISMFCDCVRRHMIIFRCPEARGQKSLAAYCSPTQPVWRYVVANNQAVDKINSTQWNYWGAPESSRSDVQGALQWSIVCHLFCLGRDSERPTTSVSNVDLCAYFLAMDELQLC